MQELPDDALIYDEAGMQNLCVVVEQGSEARALVVMNQAQVLDLLSFSQCIPWYRR